MGGSGTGPISVDTGALEQTPFASVAEDLATAGSHACAGLQPAIGAAGPAQLAESIARLVAAIAVASRAATLAVTGLGAAAAAAAADYAAHEAAIQHEEGGLR
ncbi:MAG: hypothetical protein ABSA40_10875 [Candidatus Dormibacteria bacterium]|jgi:hypothetical protein